jgi:hypothetical protein
MPFLYNGIAQIRHMQASLNDRDDYSGYSRWGLAQCEHKATPFDCISVTGQPHIDTFLTFNRPEYC